MKEKIKENKIIIGLIILIIITPCMILGLKQEKIEEPVELTSVLEEQPEIKEEKTLKIDIKGEVNKPGVYQLKKGDRVSDAIKASGGLTENADTNLINLSKNIQDEMVIIIYNKYEIENLRQELKETQTVIQYIEKECSCPDTINDACIKEAQPTKQENKTSETQKDTKISLNKGTLEELLTLPGIGESKAKAIIKYREENNGFKTIEEITNISGIGEATFEKFKDYITI